MLLLLFLLCIVYYLHNSFNLLAYTIYFIIYMSYTLLNIFKEIYNNMQFQHLYDTLNINVYYNIE